MCRLITLSVLLLLSAQILCEDVAGPGADSKGKTKEEKDNNKDNNNSKDNNSKDNKKVEAVSPPVEAVTPPVVVEMKGPPSGIVVVEAATNTTLSEASSSSSSSAPPPPSTSTSSEEEDKDDEKEELEAWSDLSKPRDQITIPPTVVVVILVRNKAHSLPNFLAFIDRLNYPRDRMSIFLRSDHNVDNSSSILREWVAGVTPLYHSLNVEINDTRGGYETEKNSMDWPDERMSALMQLREAGLRWARQIWADYVFYVDADNLLENSDVLTTLMRYRKTVIAPMLISLGRYSNWWGDMTENLYYLRSADYMAILNREKVGLFQVPMVHSTFLVDLRRSESRYLSYGIDVEAYKVQPIPFDDIIVFAYNARRHGVKFWLTNEEPFGKLIGPLAENYGVEDDKNQFINMKLESLWEDPPMPVSEHITFIPSVKTKLGFDEIYLVNLKRRPDRLTRMKACFEELGISYKLIDAVDGKKLTASYLEALDIKQCANYRDPYSNRDMTYGEIGCFMSHYKIWEDVAQNNHKKVIVFEDDIRFEPYFKISLSNLLLDLSNAGLHAKWELLYLGRKRLRKDLEPRVKGANNIVWPSYSYWTLSYLLTANGARKLLNQRPLNRLVPVDEYLPIMFDRHPNEDWKGNFKPRDLVALSAEPLLCYPTHYTGEANYISDTEESDVIPDKHVVPGEPGGTDAAAAAPQHKTAKSMYAEASRDVRAAAGGKEEL